MTRPPPKPPRPDRIRQPQGGFGWLDACLLHDRWLAEMGADAIALLVLLAIAADRNGVSYFSRGRMAAALRFDVTRVDQALERLADLGLVAHRPWRQGDRDGVWQLLPVPSRRTPARTSGAPGMASFADILRDMVIPRSP